MNAIFVLALALTSAVSAGGYHGGGYGGGYGGGHGGGHGGADFFQPAHYHFAYGVHDPHSKDVKDQHEYRDGHHVVGGYSLHEPDGTKRIVEYTSDPHHGFQAVVHREGYAQHPAVYGKHGHGGHGGHGGYGGHGGTSYVKTTHWGHGSGR